MLDLDPIKARVAEMEAAPSTPAGVAYITDVPALIAEVERLQRVAQASVAWRHSTTPAEEAALVGAVDALEGEVA